MAKAESNRFRIVDATQSVEELQSQVKELIAPLVQQVTANNDNPQHFQL